MNYAFAVSGAFLLGGHLGYTAAVDEGMIVPLLAGKLAGGISAMGVAYGMIQKSRKHGLMSKNFKIKDRIYHE